MCADYSLLYSPDIHISLFSPLLVATLIQCPGIPGTSNMDPSGTHLGTRPKAGQTANVQPRNLGPDFSGLNHSPARGIGGAYVSETIGGLGGLLHAAKMLGPDLFEEPSNDPPTSDSGADDSAFIMSELTDEGSTRSSDSETSRKHGFGESAAGRSNGPLGAIGCACGFVDRSSRWHLSEMHGTRYSYSRFPRI